MTVNALIFTEIMNPYFPPTRAAGAYRIASEIRKAGYTCQVVDFFTSFNPDEMSKIMETYIGDNTLIVGFSSTFFEKLTADNDPSQFKNNLQRCIDLSTRSYPFDKEATTEWFSRIYKINPDVKIVFGGAKVNDLSALIRTSAPADAFAIGNSDQSIIEYMRFLEGKNPFFQYEKLNDSQISFNGAHYSNKFNFTESTIDWHYSDHLAYGEAVPIEIGRGCIFSCSFCNAPMIGKKKLEYVKKASVLRDEFLRNYNEFGITRYLYGDDTHNDSIDKLEQLHSVVNSLPFEIEYAAYMRLDLIHAHKETATLLRESGVRSVYFGIESLHHPSAKSIGKGLHPDRVKETLHWLHDDVWKDEVGLGAGFIIGLPHETPDTAREWLDWLLDHSCPIDSYQISALFLDKTDDQLWISDFQRNAVKHGYELGDYGQWKNKFFTRQSALKLANEYAAATLAAGRRRWGGWVPIMASNLGYTPRDLIGKVQDATLSPAEVRELRGNFVQSYKQKILNE